MNKSCHLHPDPASGTLVPAAAVFRPLASEGISAQRKEQPAAAATGTMTETVGFIGLGEKNSRFAPDAEEFVCRLPTFSHRMDAPPARNNSSIMTRCTRLLPLLCCVCLIFSVAGFSVRSGMPSPLQRCLVLLESCLWKCKFTMR